MALTGSSLPRFATTLVDGQAVLANADGAAAIGTNSAAYKSIITGGLYGTLVDSFSCVSNDSVARNVIVAIRNGATHRVIGVFNIPANSGANGSVAVVDLLGHVNQYCTPISSQGKRYLRLKYGEELVVGVLVAVTAATNIWFSASGNDFES